MTPFTGARVELHAGPDGPCLAVVVRHRGRVLSVPITPDEWAAMVADGNTKAAQVTGILPDGTDSDLTEHCRALADQGLLTAWVNPTTSTNF